VIVSDNSLHKIFPSTTQTKNQPTKIMKKTLHTPAPWKHDPTWGIIKHGKTEICALHSGNLANANLIASAPDLLSAVDSCLEIMLRAIGERLPINRGTECEETDWQTAIRKAKEAIRKAKGE
jgi:hypothetical protein